MTDNGIPITDAFHVEQLDSLDDFFTKLREGEAAANAELTDAQRALTWGSKWVRVVMMGPEGALAIFGDVPTRDAHVASLRKIGCDEEEVEYELDTLDNALTRGYVYGKCYSTIEPDGELGSTHVSTIAAALTDDQFGQARAAGWDGALLYDTTDWFKHLGES